MILPSARKRGTSGWVGGILEGADPAVVTDDRGNLKGIIEAALNLVPTPASRMAVRGGTTVAQTFSEPGASPISRMVGLWPFTPTGAIAIGWSDAADKHYLWRLTPELAFASGLESTSRKDLTAAPSTSWDNTTTPARPVAAELFEKLYIADATLSQISRNTMLAVDSSGAIEQPAFDFDGGSDPLTPYCLEEYSNVLFIAGYDSKTLPDSPAMVRHSFLGRDPAAANGFDKDAYNTIGAKGKRVTAMRKGKNLLLVAKEHELYRITGAGRGRAGWQYAVDPVTQSRGFGVQNPLALEFIEPYWYGVGQAGPFRTNGTTIDDLGLPRSDSWAKVANLGNCFVVEHPDRTAVLFGFSLAPADISRSTVYPFVLWGWDVNREIWFGDWKMSADIFVARAIPSPGATSASGGPTTPPLAPPTIDDTAAALTSVNATFTPADATANTEIWVKPIGAPYYRFGAQAAGAGPFTIDITGLASSSTYLVKIRHEKNGVYSDFTGEAIAHTLLAAPQAPSATSVAEPDKIVVQAFCDVDGCGLKVYRDGTTLVATLPNQGIGQFLVPDPGATCGVTYFYTTKHTNPFWPVVIQDSAASAAGNSTEACAE